MTDEKASDPTLSPEKRLESWKEIAAYLGRDVRTVIRWEKSERLPVHRHHHHSRASVYAYPSELDAWRAARSAALGPTATASPKPRWFPRVVLATGLVVALAGAGDGPASPMRAEAQRQGPSLTEIFGGRQPNDAEGRFSPDGDRFAATDWFTGNLVVIEVEKEKVMRLTDTGWDRAPMEFAEAPVWSPDGGRIAYCWFRESRCELRVIRREGGSPEVLFRGKGGFFPADWSPDGKRILGFIRRDDRKYTLATISTSGERTDLRELESAALGGGRFSPDGRFVAYDTLLGGKQALFVFSLEDKVETRLTEDPFEEYLAESSPDGRWLLFVSNRSGRWDLWGQPLREGRLAGEPQLLYPDIGQVTWFNGWQDRQHLAFNKATSFGQFYTVTVDPSTGAVLGVSSTPVREYQGQHMHALWAPDGERLALLVAFARQRGETLMLGKSTGGMRRIDTGSLTWKRLAGWLPSDGPLVLSALHSSGVSGFYVVDPGGGEPRPLHEDLKMNWSTGQLSPNGAVVAYFRSEPQGSGWVLQVYDLKEKKTLRQVEVEVEETYKGLRWAPDGSALYYLSALPGRGGWRIVRLPLPEGDVEEVLAEESEGEPMSLAVSPDGRLLAYALRHAPGNQKAGINREYTFELFLVESRGGTPRKVELPRGHNPYRLAWSPDGQQIGYVSSEHKQQFLRLSGFLPKKE